MFVYKTMHAGAESVQPVSGPAQYSFGACKEFTALQGIGKMIRRHPLHNACKPLLTSLGRSVMITRPQQIKSVSFTRIFRSVLSGKNKTRIASVG